VERLEQGMTLKEQEGGAFQELYYSREVNRNNFSRFA
jgi:hypothetical protein